MGSANERRRYIVTSSPIGWVQTNIVCHSCVRYNSTIIEEGFSMLWRLHQGVISIETKSNNTGIYMITSSNGSIFRVTGPLWGEPTVAPVDFPDKDQWRGALMLSLICAWTNGWANNRYAGDLRRHRAHYDVTVMSCSSMDSVVYYFILVDVCIYELLGVYKKIIWVSEYKQQYWYYKW